MINNNSKYIEEMKEQTARLVVEGGKTATKTAKELGIDKNTVCRWVRDYRKKYNLPSHAQEKGIATNHPQNEAELKRKIKDLEKIIKEKDKQIDEANRKIEEEKEKIEILRKSLHIFMQV